MRCHIGGKRWQSGSRGPRQRAAVRLGRARGRLTSSIDLRGLPKGTFTVKIVLHLAGGRSLTSTRTYHTCAPGKHG
jgi:hypothetical protein